MRAELSQFLQVSVLLWLRSVPLFLLTPYLATGAFPFVLGSALSWAFAGALTPLALAGCSIDHACAAALSGASMLTWAGGATQLVAGLVIALGFGLPCVVFRTTGAIAQALAGSASAAVGSASLVGRAAGMIALVAAASAGALSGVARLLLSLSQPLSASGPASLELLRPLSDELVRAFGLGVSLCGPLLLGAAFAAIFVGLWARLAGARLVPMGPLLWPWLGVAVVSLCVANWLDSLPEIARAFAQSSARLLGGLP